jgi:hypothetical protein
MSRTIARLVLAGVLAIAVAAGAQQPAPQQDPKEMALSWQKKANDTRATVIGVAEELGRIGDQGNAAAKGMIDDAHRWVAEGDKSRSQGDEKMAQESFEKASYDYNMAWQHYVRAATSGLNARRILTGE